MEMRAFPVLVAGTTSVMWPTTLLPVRTVMPDGKGTSCIILPVISWPGLQLVDEIVEFSRTGKIVPLGTMRAPSFALLGRMATAVRMSVNRNRITTFVEPYVLLVSFMIASHEVDCSRAVVLLASGRMDFRPSPMTSCLSRHPYKACRSFSGPCPCPPPSDTNLSIADRILSPVFSILFFLAPPPNTGRELRTQALRAWRLQTGRSLRLDRLCAYSTRRPACLFPPAVGPTSADPGHSASRCPHLSWAASVCPWEPQACPAEAAGPAQNCGKARPKPRNQ